MDLNLKPGENMALIGHSGCGETTLLRTLLLFDSPGPKDVGEILPDDRPARRGGTRALRALRRAVQYVPQDASTILHPHRSVLAQMAVPLRTLGVMRDREEAVGRARKILASPEIHRGIWESRSHGVSGGQAQRVSIARALALFPRYLLLDGPVSRLDPILRRQILDLFAATKADPDIATSDEQEPPARGGASGEGAPVAKSGATNEVVPALAGYCTQSIPALLMVSYDLAAVACICQRILVMDEGSIIEDAPMCRLLTESAHPTIRALRNAVSTLPTTTD